MTRKRTFTKEEKLQILKEAETQGVKITLEIHGIYPATYLFVEKENATLKKLLAEKELEGHLRTEMLKKKYAWARKNL